MSDGDVQYSRDHAPCFPTLPPDPCGGSFTRTRDHITVMSSGNVPLFVEDASPNPPIPKFRAIKQEESISINESFVPIVRLVVPPAFMGIQLRMRIALSDPVAADVVRVGAFADTRLIEDLFEPIAVYEYRVPLAGHKATGNATVTIAARVLPTAWTVAVPAAGFGDAPIRSQVYAAAQAELFCVASTKLAEWERCLREHEAMRNGMRQSNMLPRVSVGGGR